MTNALKHPLPLFCKFSNSENSDSDKQSRFRRLQRRSTTPFIITLPRPCIRMLVSQCFHENLHHLLIIALLILSPPPTMLSRESSPLAHNCVYSAACTDVSLPTLSQQFPPLAQTTVRLCQPHLANNTTLRDC